MGRRWGVTPRWGALNLRQGGRAREAIKTQLRDQQDHNFPELRAKCTCCSTHSALLELFLFLIVKERE